MNIKKEGNDSSKVSYRKYEITVSGKPTTNKKKRVNKVLLKVHEGIKKVSV